MAEQRILVTGGTGFIGHHLCEDLVAKRYIVHVLTRNKERAAKQLSVPVTYHQGVGDIDPALHFDAVVNLAGEPLVGRWNSRSKQRFYESRIDTTDALYDYFVRGPQPPHVLVNGSAIGYYGPHGDEWLDEDGGVNNCFAHQLCDAWESSAKRFEEMGCRVCCVRTGVVLGKGEGALARMMPAFKLGLGGVLGSGEQWFSWIHIDDMVGVLLHCLNSTAVRGPVNATAPEPVTNRELTKSLAHALHRPAIFPMPGFAARLLFGEMADELLLTGQRVIPKKVRDTGFKFAYPELKPALQAILS